MAKIETPNGGVVTLTEQTLKELLAAVESHKEMKISSNEEKENPITVKSKYSQVEFNIYCELNSKTQESLGYGLDREPDMKDAIIKLTT